MPITNACRHDQGAVVKYLLDHGYRTDQPGPGGMYPLHVAIDEAHPSVVQVLIEFGADVNMHSKLRPHWTPLALACVGGHGQIVTSLLNAGALIETPVDNDRRPIHLACQLGKRDVTDVLISRGCDLNVVDDLGQYPLHGACQCGDAVIVERLFEGGASNVNTPDIDGSTAMHMACEEGSLEVVHSLASHGSDLDRNVPKFGTPLHTACHAGHVHIVKWLVQRGCDVNAPRKHHRPYHTDSGYRCGPFHASCMGGHAKIAAILLLHGAKCMSRDLAVAAKRGHLSVVSELVSAYPNPETWHAFLMGASTVRRRSPRSNRNYLPHIYVNDILRTIWNFVHKPSYAKDQEWLDEALQQAQTNGHVFVTDLLLRHGASQK